MQGLMFYIINQVKIIGNSKEKMWKQRYLTKYLKAIKEDCQHRANSIKLFSRSPAENKKKKAKDNFKKEIKGKLFGINNQFGGRKANQGI